MNDYNYYIRLNADSLITYAYVLPHKQAKKDTNDILYKTMQSQSWHLLSDIYNEYNEYKWLYISNSEDLQEQTEPSQYFIKNKLLSELKAYYEDCKNISITIDGITITHLFNNKWRNLLDAKISSLLVARKQNKPDTFIWMSSVGNAIMTVENLQQLLMIVEEEIIQPNYNNKLAETAYINNNKVDLDYDFKKNFLHNQVINL